MRIMTTGLIVAGILGLALPATAETAARKTLEQVASELSAKGYTIRELELEDDHFEAELVDAHNVVSEARIDGITGEILRLKRED